MSTTNRYRLATQIVDFIKDARFNPGHHLREQHISELLRVSRTPARSALKLLEERGVVESKRNLGFFVKASYDELLSLNLQVPATANESLYKKIINDRIAGKIPEKLTQSDFSRIYSVDRLIVHKTLMQLANDGLLIRNSGRGWTFPPAIDSQVALKNSYEFRKSIEPISILLDSFKFDRATLEKIRRQHLFLIAHPNISAISPNVLYETDATFHEVIAEWSGNRFFIQAIQQQNRLRQLLEIGGYSNLRRVRDWCKEHLNIIEAIENNDLKVASALMTKHLDCAYKRNPQYKNMLKKTE
jgi:DNA-binding GntR family transcriptional regulator